MRASKISLHPQVTPRGISSCYSLIWQIKKLIPRGPWGQLCILTNFTTKSPGAMALYPPPMILAGRQRQWSSEPPFPWLRWAFVPGSPASPVTLPHSGVTCRGKSLRPCYTLRSLGSVINLLGLLAHQFTFPGWLRPSTCLPNTALLLPGHTRLHLPDFFADRWDHVTALQPIECEQKWHMPPLRQVLETLVQASHLSASLTQTSRKTSVSKARCRAIRWEGPRIILCGSHLPISEIYSLLGRDISLCHVGPSYARVWFSEQQTLSLVPLRVVFTEDLFVVHELVLRIWCTFAL